MVGPQCGIQGVSEDFPFKRSYGGINAILVDAEDRSWLCVRRRGGVSPSTGVCAWDAAGPEEE